MKSVLVNDGMLIIGLLQNLYKWVSRIPYLNPKKQSLFALLSLVMVLEAWKIHKIWRRIQVDESLLSQVGRLDSYKYIVIPQFAAVVPEDGVH